MTTKNQASGLTRIFNSFSLLSNRRSAVITLLAALCLFASIPQAWGATTYAKLTTSASPADGGTAYCVLGSTFSGTATSATGQGSKDCDGISMFGSCLGSWTYSEVTFSIKATPNAGYKFNGWTKGTNINSVTSTTAASTTLTMKPQSTTSGSPTTGTMTANFIAVTVNNVEPTSIDIAPTSPTQNYTGSIDFTTSNANLTGVGDFNATPTTDGKFTVTWTRTNDVVKASYSFTGGGSYGGLSRNNTTTVSLQSKASGSTAKTCTITANFPNAKITDGSATEIYTTYSPADDTQAGVAGTAVFDVEYVDGTDNFDTPTFTGADASHFAYNSMSYADGKLTVTYTYNGNKTTGDHTATLALKVKDAIGGTDATYGSKSVTLVAHNEQEATNDASVTPAGGSPTEYATFAQALAAANGLTGSTLKLLRNVDLGTIAATQTISKAMTIDLNGKTLQATVTSAIPLLTISAATTITDSKTGGMIYNTGEINGVVYGVTVATGKTLTVSGGTIKAENTQQYFYGTSSVGGTATNKTSVGARGIQQNATATVNVEGGIIQGFASRNAYGIREEGSKANNTTLNITGGTIYAEAASYAYGVYGLGKVNISDDATITVQINTNTVNGNETYTNYRINTSKALDSYTLNGYGYGVHVTASPTNKAAECYFGTLNMTGGTINAYNANVNMVGTTVQNQYMYGVYIGAGAAIKKSNAAPDGTLTQKASAIGQISGGTINVENDGQLAYGVIVYGSYNSFDDKESIFGISNTTVIVKAYSSAYGILANATIGTSSSNYGGCYAGKIMLTNNNVTTTTTTAATSVALYAAGTMTTIKTATNATYAGEYEASGYIYVKSGTYTANSKTSYATAAITGPWTTSNPQRGAFKTYFAVDGSLGGNVESMSGIYISGGKFVANATTSHARGVWNSGTTIITGGTFEANATTTNAYGIYSNRGVVQATNATLKAVAGTGTAYGVFSEAMINDYVGWKYAADYTLTNCNITASTTTGNTAYGVFINGTTRTISSVNSSYASIGDVVLGGYAIVGNASVKGCTINATSAGTTAGGIYRVNTQVSANKLDICQGELTATGNTITAKTNGGKTVYGIRSGGPSTISNNTITTTSSSTDSYGIIVGDGAATISGNTVTASGTGTVYGIQTYSAASSTNGYLYQSNATLEDNTVTATTTSGNTAYAVYVTTANNVNIASGDFAGDYIAAGSMVINSGKYTATAAGTTGYALVLDATKKANATSGSATCTVNGGKFKGTASSTYADVNASAGLGNLVLAGGYYVVNTNLNTYVADGYTATSLTSGDAYTEGYRYQISSEATGAIVCKVYNGTTLKASYQSLEEAIGYVNQNASTTLTILMVDNYTLSEGEYTLPAKTTLLVPYSGQTTAKTTSLERVYGYTKPTANIKLSFAPNAHLDVLGTIEAGSKQAGSGQTGGYNGAPHLSYGWIYLSAGSSMTLENGAKLFAWGYVTGAGEIDAKRGSTVYEMFQLTDWRGGTAISGMEGNSQKVMPVNQYYIQNVECPIKFRPGAVELCEGSCNMSSSVYPVRGKNSSTSIQFIGITGSGSLFMMDDEDVSNDTWVRKSYDAVNDKQVYEINSSAKIGGISITCCDLPWIGSKTLSSTDYVMPITNNLKIHLLSGSMYITQNLELAAGAEIEVDKEATAYVNSGVSLYVFDTDEWDVFETKYNSKTYPVRYTPSWTTCPRSVSNVPDAAINVHGKFIVNGNLYTTASGANIFSTNEDAGSITYNVAAPTGTKTVYVCNNTSQTYNSKTCYPAWLQNGTGITPAYSETAGTAAGKTWSYYDDKWQCWTQSGCFTYDAVDNKYIKPAAYVQVTSTSDANHLYTDAATGTRKFVWDADCYWWEVETTPTAEGYYKAINADHNGKYNYYYYDSANGYWVIKTIVVTWSINGSTTNYTVNYGTVPKWLGTNPYKAATASVYYSWTGWTKGSTTGTFYSKYEDLPVATAAVTYYAYFETNKYSYTITFADANNGTSVSKTFTADEIPVCPITPVKAPTTALMYTYDGWSTTSGGSKDYDKNDNLPAVSGTATYYAHFSSSARPYTITFQNYDGTVLQQSDVNYGTMPTYAGATPARAENAFYSYSFREWSPAIASVTGEATYTAQFNEVARSYRVTWDATTNGGTCGTGYSDFSYNATIGTLPAATKTGYTFNGWFTDPIGGTQITAETKVIAAVTYYAQFSINNYTVTIVKNENSYGSVSATSITSVPYGTAVSTSGNTLTISGKTPVTAPPTAATAQYTYAFDHWNNVPATVTGNVTIEAVFTRSVNQYTVLWKSEDGASTLETDDNQNYGAATAFNGTTPTKDATAQYTYTFDGWATEANGAKVYEIGATPIVSGAATYYAHFAATLRKYTMSVAATPAGYGTVSAASVAEVPYGTAVTENGNKITVNGTTITATPAAATAQYTYAFSQWDNVPATVTGNVSIEAVFTRTVNQYTVLWKSEDGTSTIETDDSQNYGAATAFNGTAPTKDATAQYTYTFDGWATEANGAKVYEIGATPIVSGAATYYAHFAQTTNAYTVTWKNADGTELEKDEDVSYGTTPEYNGGTPVKDADDDYVYTFSGWTPAIAAVTGDQTYTATYTQSQNMPLDIVDATDNTIETSLIINTNTNIFASSGWPYTINGTSYAKTDREADRTLVFTHTYEEGTSQQITVKNKDGVIVSSHTYTIPLVRDGALGNPTLSGTNANSIVFVSENTILTVGADASAAAIYVSPTAELKIEPGVTLTVGKLVLRTSPSSSAILTNEGTLNATQTYYSRITRDQEFHLFAIPLASNTADVVLSDGSSCAVASTVMPYGNAWVMREYNAQRRADNGSTGENWDNIGWTGPGYTDASVAASKAYEMRAGSKYYREYRFPVTLPTTATSVPVTYATGSAGSLHAGWNILCSPYTHTYSINATDPATGIKVCWQQGDEWIEEQPSEIKPARPFAYQADAAGALDFTTSTFTLRAPRHQSEMEAQTEWLQLDLTDGNGLTDQTSVYVHPSRFTAGYEAGIDLAKQSLASTRPILYTTHAYGDMAFAGVSDEALEQGIALTFNSPTAQTLTLSLRDNEWLNRMAYVWLLDNETGERTDLLMDDYRFAAPAGTTAGRLVLQGRFYAPQVATGLDETGADYRIYNLNGNIAVSGVEAGTVVYVFDAVGHMLYHGTAEAEDILIPAPSAGVYMLHIGGKTAKMVINK